MKRLTLLVLTISCLYFGCGEEYSDKPQESSRILAEPYPNDSPYTPDSRKLEEFPIAHRPYQSFTSGIRRFGAARGGGSRLHAAADLYSSVGNAVRAVSSGIITDYYYFYSGTYAAVIEHTMANGSKRVVRYGEISGFANGFAVGSRVHGGDTFARIGKLNCCSPMLHFEYFEGTLSGPLTTNAGPFRRRSDLLNPNQLLLRLYDEAGY
ncbi:MAG: hypothetical protein HRU19_20300 [Pseudobacteriovorax sp.]|nr:hypothetical protein [Pseudobacteriovorax sp.]